LDGGDTLLPSPVLLPMCFLLSHSQSLIYVISHSFHFGFLGSRELRRLFDLVEFARRFEVFVSALSRILRAELAVSSFQNPRASLWLATIPELSNAYLLDSRGDLSDPCILD